MQQRSSGTPRSLWCGEMTARRRHSIGLTILAAWVFAAVEPCRAEPSAETTLADRGWLSMAAN